MPFYCTDTDPDAPPSAREKPLPSNFASEALRKMFSQGDLLERMNQELVNLMFYSKSDQVRIAAIRIAYDRLEGRPSRAEKVPAAEQKIKWLVRAGKSLNVIYSKDRSIVLPDGRRASPNDEEFWHMVRKYIPVLPEKPYTGPFPTRFPKDAPDDFATAQKLEKERFDAENAAIEYSFNNPSSGPPKFDFSKPYLRPPIAESPRPHVPGSPPPQAEPAHGLTAASSHVIPAEPEHERAPRVSPAEPQNPKGFESSPAEPPERASVRSQAELPNPQGLESKLR